MFYKKISQTAQKFLQLSHKFYINFRSFQNFIKTFNRFHNFCIKILESAKFIP